MEAKEPLDFEKEDQLLNATPRKRRKVIGLDDLLTDYYEAINKVVDCKPKNKSFCKGYNSDEDEKTQRKKERMLSKFVENCEKQVNEMNTEDEIPLWNQRLFGQQKSPPLFESMSLSNCQLLQFPSVGDLDSVFQCNAGQEECFLEGLLVNRWLAKLTFISGHVEDSVANWVFHKLLYSPNEDIEDAACEFWCDILLSKDEADKPLVSLGWFPNYHKLMEALESYGYMADMFDSHLTSSKEAQPADCLEGPPRNISSWIKFLCLCCQIRSYHQSIFSKSEAEELLSIIIHLVLDRQLQGLLLTLNECMQSMIGYFREDEWDASCEKVARSVVSRIPNDINSLRILECISVTNNRSKHLRSQIALQFLILHFGEKVNSHREVLEFLLSVNMKEKGCDFLKIYIYLVLVENSLLCHPPREDLVLTDLWCKYLQNCSTQITSTDWRSYASKVRSKASYILQSTTQRNC
ncbi:uncharacterized protein LOC121988634 isoform X1 [Zingiber officinale]|uniref:uncharacterized protein LOC121988634 isoform X1 n=1 Tax=Zingiber officinale TaxID=94328 RepID=UPI001C4AC79C|nr:uncharacterized protein LOC121988634 isoform X1 [Zingiber officinale]